MTAPDQGSSEEIGVVCLRTRCRDLLGLTRLTWRAIGATGLNPPIGGLWSIVMLASGALALGLLSSCKMSSPGKTESFRATKRDWWIFGKEHTSLILHQIVPDPSASQRPNKTSDPLLQSVRGVAACWYPLEFQSKVLDPLIKAGRMSELYDLAPTPITEYAVPYEYLIMAIEKRPELRNINTSFKKAAARMAVDLPVDTAVDFALCTAGIAAVGGLLAAALFPVTGGLSAVAAVVATSVPLIGVSVASAACTIATSTTGAFSAVKAPLNPILNPIKDSLAQGVGNTLNDTEGRRKAIAERLFPLSADGKTLEATVESSVDQIPTIGWDEMESLQKLLAALGSSQESAYPDGTRKALSQQMRCKSIPVLKAQNEFYSPDLEQLPQSFQNELRERGYSPTDIEAFTKKREVEPQLDPRPIPPTSNPPKSGSGISPY